MLGVIRGRKEVEEGKMTRWAKTSLVGRASGANERVVYLEDESFGWECAARLGPFMEFREFPPHVKIQPRLADLWEHGNSSHRPLGVKEHLKVTREVCCL